MSIPDVFHLADGRVALVTGATEVAYYRPDYAITTEPPIEPKAKRGKKAGRKKHVRVEPVKRKRQPKGDIGGDVETIKQRCRQLKEEGLTIKAIHETLLQEGYDVKYSRVWSWLNK